MRREWIEMLGREIKTIPENGLPPCGGSGLKYMIADVVSVLVIVSLHAEGVD